MIYYCFDGSFTGLLCCIFRAYQFKERQFKDRQIQVVWDIHFQPEFFAEAVTVGSDEKQAKRVWRALIAKTSADFKRHFYWVYLSEQAAAFQNLFNAACYIFDQKIVVHENYAPHKNPAVYENYGHPDILAVMQFARSVNREKHRMEAFVRFKKTEEGLFLAIISPDFNVLPLICPHFKRRYADQRWLIYDEKRRYGSYYDLKHIHDVVFNSHERNSLVEGAILQDSSITLDASEALYDQLWKDYFKSTNIVERRNIKLHLQHVPRRYWKYLTEKN